MVGRDAGAVVREVDRIFNRGTISGLTEGQLIDRFVTRRDEEAFGALVTRHGPMVLGVCRRVLRNEHDIEDAFQATFFILVRRAREIRNAELVGNWLYGVAHRVAVRARAIAAQRYVREQPVVQELAEARSAGEVERRELRAVLDEELARLPKSLRAPLVLCYLDGLTHDEAARRLRWPVGTVRSRMARARTLLRQRLGRRGMVPTGAALTASLAAEPVSAALLDTTVRTSMGFAATQATAAALASVTALTLAKGVLHAMTISKLKILGAATLACVLALGGARTVAYQLSGIGGNQRPVGSETDDPRVALIRVVDKLQTELAESSRRNAELQKQVQTLRTDLEALRVGQPAAAGKGAGNEEVKTKRAIGPAGFVGGEMGGRDGPQFYRFQVPERLGLSDNYEELIMATSADGSQVRVYNAKTAKAQSIRLDASKEAPVKVTPLMGAGALALDLTGPKITRVAVFDFANRTWHPLDLREAVKGRVSSTVGDTEVVYAVGRYIYAFSLIAKRWSLLELPEGAKPVRTAFGSTSFEHDGHLYDFDAVTAKWRDIDLRTILDAPEDLQKDNAEPKN